MYANSIRQLIKSRHQIKDLSYPVSLSIFWALRRKNIMLLICLLILEWLIHVSYVFNKKHTTNFRNSLCTSTGNYSWLVITAYFLYVLHSHVIFFQNVWSHLKQKENGSSCNPIFICTPKETRWFLCKQYKQQWVMINLLW